MERVLKTALKMALVLLGLSLFSPQLLAQFYNLSAFWKGSKGPDTVSITGPSGIVKSECRQIYVNLLRGGTLTNALTNTTVTLSGNGSGTFYSDIGCGSSITSTTINSGKSSKIIYFKNGTAETDTLRGTSGSLTQVTLAVTVQAGASGWVLRSPATSPPAKCANNQLVYHAARKSVIMYGGRDSSSNPTDDMWEWDGTNWTQLCTGCGPGKRAFFGLAYDSIRNVIVLFGGQTDTLTYTNDTWEWNGTTWAQRSPGGSIPTARYGFGTAYDAGRGKVVIFGGDDSGSKNLDQVWEYDGTNWAGPVTPATRPQGRESYSNMLVYDPVQARILLFSGNDINASNYFKDTWSWNGTTWTQICANCLGTPAGGSGLAYDSARNKLVSADGNGSSAEIVQTVEMLGSTNAWTITPNYAPLPGRDSSGMAYDPNRGQSVFYGGNGPGCGDPHANETWEYNGLPPEPTQLAFITGAQSIKSGNCSGVVTVQSQNGSGTPNITVAGITLNLSGSGMTYYSDSTCTTPVTSAAITTGNNSQSFYFVPATTSATTVTVAATGFTTINQTETIPSIDPFTWTGGVPCAPVNWSTGACWSGGVAPGTTDTAHFDTNCTTNCTPTISTAIDVGGLWLHPGYAGTISPGGNTMTFEQLGIHIEAGTFTGAGATITDKGDFVLNGGTFTSTSGILYVKHDFTVNGTPTFNNNSGTVIFNANGNGTDIHASPINFYNVQFAGTAGGWWAPFNLYGTMNVVGDLTMNNENPNVAYAGSYGARFSECQAGAIIKVWGNVTGNSGGSDFRGECGQYNVTLQIVGSGTQNITASGDNLPRSFVIASTGTVNFSNTVYSGDWTYTSGTLNMGASTINFVDSPTGITSTGMHFNNVIFGNGTQGLYEILLTDMYVDGNLTIQIPVQGNIAGWNTIYLKGNMNLIDQGLWGATNLTFVGGQAQTFNYTAGSGIGGTVTVNKTVGTTLTLQGNMDMAGADFVLTSGTVDQNGHNLSTMNNFTVGASGTLMQQGAENIQANAYSFDPASTFIYYGSGSYNEGLGPLSPGNLTFNGTGTWTQTDNWTVQGNLTVQNGTFAQGAQTVTVGGNWVHSGGTFSANTGTVAFTGNASHTISGTNTFYNLSMTTSAAETLTFPAGVTTTISNNTGTALSLTGSSGNVLSLRSSTGGSQFNISPAANTTLGGYLDVKDSNNNSGKTLHSGANFTNSGNNTNWTFP